MSDAPEQPDPYVTSLEEFLRQRKAADEAHETGIARTPRGRTVIGLESLPPEAQEQILAALDAVVDDEDEDTVRAVHRALQPAAQRESLSFSRQQRARFEALTPPPIRAMFDLLAVEMAESLHYLDPDHARRAIESLDAGVRATVRRELGDDPDSYYAESTSLAEALLASMHTTLRGAVQYGPFKGKAIRYPVLMIALMNVLAVFTHEAMATTYHLLEPGAPMAEGLPEALRLRMRRVLQEKMAVLDRDGLLGGGPARSAPA